MPPALEAVRVLYADDRRDGLGLGKVMQADIGDAQVANEPGLA